LLSLSTSDRFHPDEFAVCGSGEYFWDDVAANPFGDYGDLLAVSRKEDSLVAGLQLVGNQAQQRAWTRAVAFGTSQEETLALHQESGGAMALFACEISMDGGLGIASVTVLSDVDRSQV